MNLVAQANQLKSLPDEYLAQQLQHPDGQFPPYLVMTELQNRTRVRQQSQAEEGASQPATTVAQELMAQSAQRLPENQGIATLPQAQVPTFAGGGIVALANGGLMDAVRQVESGNRDFNPDGTPVRSPRGAMYASQVMPATAGDPGWGVRPAQDASPEEYNRVGAEYLQALIGKYGSVDRALGAYNMGPGRMDQLLAQHGNNWIDHAPEETQNYVPSVLARTQASMETAPPDGGAGLGALAAVGGGGGGGMTIPSMPGMPGISSGGSDPAGGMISALIQAIQAQETGGQYDVAQMQEGGQPRNFKEWWEAQQDEGVSGGRLFGRALRTGADSLGRALGEDASRLWSAARRTAYPVQEALFGAIPELEPQPGADIDRATVAEVVAAEPAPPADTPPAQPYGVLRADGAVPSPAPMATPAAEPDPNVEVTDLYEQVFGEGARARTPEEIRAAQEAFLAADPEQARRDAWMALARAGFTAASGTSPNMMQNLSQGAMSGLEALQQSDANQRRQQQLRDLLAYQEHRGDRDYERKMREAELLMASRSEPGMDLGDMIDLEKLRLDKAKFMLELGKAGIDTPTSSALMDQAVRGDPEALQRLQQTVGLRQYMLGFAPQTTQ